VAGSVVGCGVKCAGKAVPELPGATVSDGAPPGIGDREGEDEEGTNDGVED